MKRHTVFFYSGDELTLKTRVTRGKAWVDDSGLHVTAKAESFVIPAGDVKVVDMFRLHGLGRVVRVDHQNGRLFISVVRLMIGQFAIINFLRTGALRQELANLINR